MYLVNNILKTKTKLITQTKRHLWGYVSTAFNTVDVDRLEAVGPDRLCAEWIIKNGGAVRFAGSDQIQKDYNQLGDDKVKHYIKEVDATDATIMKLGFEHFRGCRFIEKIIFHKCLYMENSALGELQYVEGSLKTLQVSSCYNVTDDGLLMLKNLTNLNHLLVFDLPYVKDLVSTTAKLVKLLPNCAIKVKADT